MSRFSPNDDAWQDATTDPADRCPICRLDVGNCTCEEPATCIWCGGEMHRWPDWAPYCCPICAISAEADSKAS